MLSALELRRRSGLLSWTTWLLPLAAAGGCDPAPHPPPAPGAPAAELAEAPAELGAPEPEPAAAAAPPDAGADGGRDLGPHFTVTTSSTGIYAEPSADRALKLGYARSGGRLPVLPTMIEGDGCAAGWYPLRDGGYVCSSEGSLDDSDPLVRLAVSPPDLSSVLPYPYARNVQNGTPLYTSVPSRDQIATYEPWFQRGEAQRLDDTGSLAWWQRKEAALSSVRLAELDVESDGVLGRRMVKGFYVAVDREFEWDSRSWYKTTKGMVAPKDRLVAVEGSTFQGVELASELELPVAWVYGYRESRPTFTFDEQGKARESGTLERFSAIHLVGEPVQAGRHEYVQAAEGFWVRTDHVRTAGLPPIPIDVERDEHWIYVDLTSQTLVAMSGSNPVYATLVSSGKASEDEARDHRTPPGEWRIREKHLTTTMDGDGTAAGDLPYSIEDVPYVMYFNGSYALHAAFWHRNYGVRMSHGCINLAPLDAKYLFRFTGPAVQAGWHGAWAGNGQMGSRVVIDGPERGAPAERHK